MSSINTIKYAALGDKGYINGHINDRFLAYLKAGGATSNNINDAQHEFLVANGATPGNSLFDQWTEVLLAAGYIDPSLNDKLYKFWSDGGTLGVPLPPITVTGNGWRVLTPDGRNLQWTKTDWVADGSGDIRPAVRYEPVDPVGVEYYCNFTGEVNLTGAGGLDVRIGTSGATPNWPRKTTTGLYENTALAGLSIPWFQFVIATTDLVESVTVENLVLYPTGGSINIDPVVAGSKDAMTAEGWNCEWVVQGQSYRIIRQNDPTEYFVDRAYLDGCDYSSMPGPMANDLMDYAQAEGVCPV